MTDERKPLKYIALLKNAHTLKTLQSHPIQPQFGGCEGLRRTGRSNPSSETQFSGSNEDREIYKFSSSADREQDWQSYLVDPCSAESADNTNIHTTRR